MKPSELTPEIASKILSLYKELFGGETIDRFLDYDIEDPTLFIARLNDSTYEHFVNSYGSFRFGSRWTIDSKLQIYKGEGGNMSVEFDLNGGDLLPEEEKKTIKELEKRFYNECNELLNPSKK